MKKLYAAAMVFLLANQVLGVSIKEEEDSDCQETVRVVALDEVTDLGFSGQAIF